jgi:Peptidase C13 family
LTDDTDQTATRTRSDAVRALLAILAFWTIQLGYTAFAEGSVGRVSPEGLQSALAWAATVIGGLFLAAITADISRFAASVRTTFLLATVFYAIAALYAEWFAEPLQSVLVGTVSLLAMTGGLTVAVFLVHRSADVPLPRALLAGLLSVAALGVAQFLVIPASGLVALEAAGPSADASSVEVRDYALAQGPLLADQIDQLASGTNGQPELFALLVAASAEQSVFLNEVEGVRTILDAQHGTGRRSLVLGNSLRAPLKYPEASWQNLDRALAELSRQMGPEDVLFLFLTSHGNTDRLSLTFHPAAGRRDALGLDAVGFADLVKQRVVNPMIVVISACKSGSFIDDLAAPDRLIITASAADRVSFGCQDGADWTYFGKQFFDVALRAEPDPRKAFAAALPLIEKAEAALEWAAPSQPQISEGANIGPALDQVLASGELARRAD